MGRQGPERDAATHRYQRLCPYVRLVYTSRAHSADFRGARPLAVGSFVLDKLALPWRRRISRPVVTRHLGRLHRCAVQYSRDSSDGKSIVQTFTNLPETSATAAWRKGIAPKCRRHHRLQYRTRENTGSILVSATDCGPASRLFVKGEHRGPANQSPPSAFTYHEDENENAEAETCRVTCVKPLCIQHSHSDTLLSASHGAPTTLEQTRIPAGDHCGELEARDGVQVALAVLEPVVPPEALPEGVGLVFRADVQDRGVVCLPVHAGVFAFLFVVQPPSPGSSAAPCQ